MMGFGVPTGEGFSCLCFSASGLCLSLCAKAIATPFRLSPSQTLSPMSMASIQLVETSNITDREGEHLLVVDVEPEVKFLIRNLTTEGSGAVGGEGVQRSILNGINAEIPKGMVVGIIGPSGGGKSTLLRALNRLWEPPPHTVFLDGHDICGIDVLTLRRKVGMLFQIPALFEGTVADNIRYGPQLQGKKLPDNEVYKLLTLADLDSSFFNKNARELSVGQAQRVALARTLANEPEVLLLDEPTSALDPISTQNIEDVIVKLKKKNGMTIIMVSHSIKQIQRIADLVCLLVDGQIVEVLKPNSLSQANHPMALRFLQLST
ncbi:ABC transporter I family member 17-like isoform X2 [Actinidia eriantha]|uniref:ABC transporter I family member 17-like isoform X2 n=1 Tax=Actinidia eriantha TaxID=165200 RepID=UPI00258AA2DA|nr:ABC transporter I family member 17-like isoform X2 [Actinidia eriantha]